MLPSARSSYKQRADDSGEAAERGIAEKPCADLRTELESTKLQEQSILDNMKKEHETDVQKLCRWSMKPRGSWTRVSLTALRRSSKRRSKSSKRNITRRSRHSWPSSPANSSHIGRRWHFPNRCRCNGYGLLCLSPYKGPKDTVIRYFRLVVL